MAIFLFVVFDLIRKQSRQICQDFLTFLKTLENTS